MSLKRKIGINVASNIALPVTSFLSAPLLAHGLGVVGRGEVAGATAPLFLLTIAAAVGLPDAVTYFCARSRTSISVYLSPAIWLTLASGLVSSVGLFFASEALSKGDADLRDLMILAGIALTPTMLIGVVRGAAIGLQHFRLVFWERILAYVGRLAVLVALWASGMLTPLTAVCAISFAPLLGIMAYIPLLCSARGVREGANVKVFGYGLRMWVGTLSGVVLSRIDQVLMIPLSSASALGIYAVAVSISEVPLVLNASLREVLFAVDSAENDRGRMAQVGRLSTVVTIAVCLLFAALCPVGIPLLFGRDFESAVDVCFILLLAVAVGNPGSIAATALTSLGRPGLRSLCLATACVANVASILALVPLLGAMGAAWATLAGNLVSSTLAVLFCRLYGGYGLFDFYGVRVRDLRALYRGVAELSPRR